MKNSAPLLILSIGVLLAIASCAPGIEKQARTVKFLQEEKQAMPSEAEVVTVVTGDAHRQFSRRRQAIPALTCKDSDATAEYPNGKNIFTKGTIAGPWAENINGPVDTQTDYCVDAQNLQEYLCVPSDTANLGSPKGIGQSGHLCPAGTSCKDGACVAAPQPSQVCKDIDGQSYSTKSYVEVSVRGSDVVYVHDDYCAQDGVTLFEQSCLPSANPDEFGPGNFYLTTSYVCPNGCKDGACMPAPVEQPLLGTAYSCTKVLDNSNAGGKINLFFISDGFTTSTANAFYDNVKWGLDFDGNSHGLFSKVPYAHNKNLFNIFTIFSEDIFDCLTSRNSGPNAIPCEANKIVKIPIEACGISKIDYVGLVGYPYSPINPNEARSGIWNAGKLSVLRADLTDPNWIRMSINHEVGGHGIGGLGDETYLAYLYTESWNITSNVDKPGCPKWCSGQINANEPCYQTYLEWKNCVQPYLDRVCVNGGESYSCGTSGNIKSCTDAAYEKEMQAGSNVVNCNIGVDCISGTGCYWGAGYSLAGFRATQNSIMYSAYLNGNYGPVGERIISDRLTVMAK